MTALQPSAVGPRPIRQRRWTRRTRRDLLTGLLFISPWILGFLGFYLYPAVASLYYSFTDFRILQDPDWIGLQNYQRMLA
ncbi:MAG: multiple sugar transport system permease protein, partial [Chloroflexota bacterium]|nr:multiple sugar transport system permease protein [Chloroflexota bacterium]